MRDLRGKVLKVLYRAASTWHRVIPGQVEVEQAAFAPANVVPGISFSPDKMLQARILSYPDAHRHRMGVNYDALPVNKPKCPVHTYHRDGHLRFDKNGGATPNYEPNTFGGPMEDPAYKEVAWNLGDSVVARYDHKEGNDDDSQAGDLFRLMSPVEQARLIGNIVASMRTVPRDIQVRQIKHFFKADPKYGEGVAEGLGHKLEEVLTSERVLSAVR